MFHKEISLINKDLDIEMSDLEGESAFSGERYVVVCHASYEDRSLSICEHLFAKGMVIASILLSSEEYLDKEIYISNKNKLKSFLTDITSGIVADIVAEKDRPISNLKKVADALLGFDVTEMNFLIDISTFPRDRLICLLDYIIRIRGEGAKIEFIYTAPEGYGSEKQGGWLSRGVRKIEPVPRFNGKQKTRRDTLLVMLLGHEGQRSLITLRNLEPDHLIIISQGKIQVNTNTQKVSEDSNESLLSESRHLLLDDGIIEAPYSDPSNIDNILEEIWDSYSDRYNIVVSVCGTKLQVLGALLTCLRHREIQIIYAYPQHYNIEDYSQKIGSKHWGEFIFKS